MANIPKAEELFSTYVEYSNNLIQTYETNWHDIWKGYVGGRQTDKIIGYKEQSEIMLRNLFNLISSNITEFQQYQGILAEDDTTYQIAIQHINIHGYGVKWSLLEDVHRKLRNQIHFRYERELLEECWNAMQKIKTVDMEEAFNILSEYNHK